MREIAFIRQNKEKWLEFERALQSGGKKNPDELSSLYIQLINDLSFAQTYYPKSKIVTYLNDMAARVYQKIYKTRRMEKNRLVHFFKTEVPLLCFGYRRYIFYAFILFFLSVAIGVISAANDTDFVRLIMGDGYVNMTMENIDKGNPVAVYKSGSNWGSFIGITLNNLYVGARCYFYGISAGILTFQIAFSNGVMLGAFQYMFYDQDVFWESVRGIWIHGAMEIFGIVIETAAGFILGASLLFPRTLSRLDSLKIGFQASFKIYLSTWAFTIAAGFLEGFITRYSVDMPIWASSLIILSTLALISWYYILYPIVVHKKHLKGLA